MEPGEELDPEDILSSSLQTLYEYQPITLASAGSVYTYVSKYHFTTGGAPLRVTLRTPDTLPANWFLHASDIWASSLYLADHIHHLDLHSTAEPLLVLELGAAAGLPGILIAKTHDVLVTVSDYPDERLIQALSHNVHHNGVSRSCRSVAHAWGSDASTLLGGGAGFDRIIAADTLWNPDLHVAFVETLRLTLKKTPSARTYLVAGLHTGRYTIQSFLSTAKEAGFEIENALEKEITGQGERTWDAEREDNEDDKERRRWVIWMILRWQFETL